MRSFHVPPKAKATTSASATASACASTKPPLKIINPRFAFYLPKTTTTPKNATPTPAPAPAPAPTPKQTHTSVAAPPRQPEKQEKQEKPKPFETETRKTTSKSPQAAKTKTAAETKTATAQVRFSGFDPIAALARANERSIKLAARAPPVYAPALSALSVSGQSQSRNNNGDDDDDVDKDLWETCYAPEDISDFVGNTPAVREAVLWLTAFKRACSQTEPTTTEAVKPALLIEGPSGVGKTLLARLLLKRAGYAVWTGRGCNEGPPSKRADESNGTLGEELVAKLRARRIGLVSTRPVAVLLETLEGVSSSTIDALLCELKITAGGPGKRPDTATAAAAATATSTNTKKRRRSVSNNAKANANAEHDDDENSDCEKDGGNGDNDKDEGNTNEEKHEKDKHAAKEGTRRARIPLIITVDDAWPFKTIAKYCCVVKLQRSDLEVQPAFQAWGGATRTGTALWKPVAPSDDQICSILSSIVPHIKSDILRRIVSGAQGSVRAAVNALQFELRVPLARRAQAQGKDDDECVGFKDAILDMPAAASLVCYGSSAMWNAQNRVSSKAPCNVAFLDAFNVGDVETIADLCQRAAPHATQSMAALVRALEFASSADLAFCAIRTRQAFELTPNATTLGAWGVGAALRSEAGARASAGTKNDARFGIKPGEVFAMWGATSKRSAARRQWRLVGAATASPVPGLSAAARALMCRPYALASDADAAQTRADAVFYSSSSSSSSSSVALSALASSKLASRVHAARKSGDAANREKQKQTDPTNQNHDKTEIVKGVDGVSSLIAEEDVPHGYPASSSLMTTHLCIADRVQVLRLRMNALLAQSGLRPSQHAQRKTLLEEHALFVAEDAARALFTNPTFPSLPPITSANDARPDVVLEILESL
jgi:hypothetical protein